jgi:hypothetical protein
MRGGGAMGGFIGSWQFWLVVVADICFPAGYIYLK